MQKYTVNTALFCYSITICKENKLKVFRSFIHGIYTSFGGKPDVFLVETESGSF